VQHVPSSDKFFILRFWAGGILKNPPVHARCVQWQEELQSMRTSLSRDVYRGHGIGSAQVASSRVVYESGLIMVLGVS